MKRLAAMLAAWAGAAAVAAGAGYAFTDRTPDSPAVAGDYQRYVTITGDGTNLSLWYENRSAGTIEMRTSTTGYAGFGTPVTATGLSGLAHPKIYGGGGGGGCVGFFWDSAQTAPNGIKRLTSSDGVNWSGATQVTVAGAPYTTQIWGVVGYFEDVSGDTDVLYYTQGTGANEKVYRATATDGVSFAHQGTAFENPGTTGCGAGVSVGSQVLYEPNEGQYLLIWCGESTTANIGYATSSDGVSFAHHGEVVLETAAHDDLEETSFVINGADLVGVYTADFGGDSSNHIGAYTGVVPEPATMGLIVFGGALALAGRRRKSTQGRTEGGAR